MPYRLPNEEEREGLFAWLKQATSLTGWRRAYAYHQAFMDVMEQTYEESQRTQQPDEEQVIPAGHWSDLLRSHDAFRVALDRLARGERQCFHFLWGTPGYFAEAVRQADWYSNMWDGLHMGRNGFAIGESKWWPAVSQALSDFLLVRGELSPALETRLIDVPASVYNIDEHKHLDTYVRPLRAAFGVQATKVPVVVPPVLVRTGETVPHYGIWEPVEAERASGLLGAFRMPVPPRALGNYPIDGCMNYLFAESPAPTLDFLEDNPKNKGRPVWWRLLWKDERYTDGSIPAEEAHYAWNQPDPKGWALGYEPKDGVPGRIPPK